MKKPIITSIFLLLYNPIFASNKVLLKEKITTNLDLKEVFLASPFIYSILIFLSVTAVSIWVYCLLTFRVNKNINKNLYQNIKNLLIEKNFDKALTYCETENSVFSKIVSTAINLRTHDPLYISDTMKQEGQRHTIIFWQRLSMLNEIVVVAPMLGLLGTVIGMFYAFYDINRSVDSIASLFDGLGIAIGTTVAGLIVAIIAMIFHATLKFRLIKMLNAVENEAFGLSTLLNTKTIKRKVKE
ncbi:MAG: hypothetical protein A3F40_03245 [Chlamydiae bacterium RIFCSPHIGHO2_12_FULL_27_8]|nr:MAG: hypothetical protein A3F40_03245 [Chlamydiae bacterium RIFCSPHIGHO2_12_FULL_27_8]OGN64885.1 MAG: hypothetical protein A2888_03480 [Chlamydiae bacterium RIFCSPLOWO2_01_FULL_28_7]